MIYRTAWWVIVAIVPLAGFVGAWPGDAEDIHAAGVAAHLERNLSVASALYGKVLSLEPPRPASAEQIGLVWRFAPRLFTTASEPFALRDAAAIVHPTSRTIAYHLFWEDDIDFPDDNDPCDHEVVWVRYAADGKTREQVWTYFHGRILPGPAGSDRARVNIQWGKHGSLPENWREQRIRPYVSELPDGIPQSVQPIALEEYLDGAYRKLSSSGRRLRDHPIAARFGWPDRFSGRREDFLSFPREVDMRSMLTGHTVLVSRFNNATLNRWILPYNFRPKTEWPDED